MQQSAVQQTFALKEDKLQFIEEISALCSLAEMTGVAGPLLAELDVFKQNVEYLDSSVWEDQEVRVLKRKELARLYLAVLRANNSRSF